MLRRSIPIAHVSSFTQTDQSILPFCLSIHASSQTKKNAPTLHTLHTPKNNQHTFPPTKLQYLFLFPNSFTAAPTRPPAPSPPPRPTPPRRRQAPAGWRPPAPWAAPASAPVVLLLSRSVGFDHMNGSMMGWICLCRLQRNHSFFTTSRSLDTRTHLHDPQGRQEDGGHAQRCQKGRIRRAVVVWMVVFGCMRVSICV